MGQQPTLDRMVIQGELQELRKTVEDVRLALAELKERVMKTETDVGIIEAGYHAVCNALEINGLMAAGEPVEAAKKEPTVTVKEETFACLSFEPQKGERLGDYETASAKNNLPDKFNAAFNVLSKSNATISARYRGGGYVHSYWLFHETIYRQKLKKT